MKIKTDLFNTFTKIMIMLTTLILIGLITCVVGLSVGPTLTAWSIVGMAVYLLLSAVIYVVLDAVRMVKGENNENHK